MKAKIISYHNVICPNEHGVNGKDSVTIINRRVKLENCKKCKWYKGYDMGEYIVICNYKGNENV